jgi:hypothetical protein
VSLAAFWVGIDGCSSGSVEQDGTLAECYGGRAYQYTWWEMYPTNAIQVVGTSLHAGDSISASVVRSGSSYALKVTDSSRSGNNVNTTQSCSSRANSSAEWIAEATSGSSGVYPLSDFHSWTESGATVKTTSSGVISSFTDDEITMINSSGAIEAQPGALTAVATDSPSPGTAARSRRSGSICPAARCAGLRGILGLIPPKYRTKSSLWARVLCLSGFPAECRSSP